MKSVLIALASLATVAALANDPITRTDKTDQYQVITVGQCVISQKTDFNNQQVFESTLPVTNCQEYKTYQANVTGKSWNKTVTPIPGTETLSYKMEDATEIRTGELATDALGYLKTLQRCNEKRTLLMKLAETARGQVKCTL
jgi:hypothetical protein